MKHDYTDEEIKEAENEAFRRKPIAKGHEWVKAFLDALPARLPPLPKTLPPRPPRPEPKASQQEAIDAAFLDSRHISLWAVADSPYWEKEAPDRLALAQVYEQVRPQSAEIVEMRAELDYARKTIEEKAAEIAALKDALLQAQEAAKDLLAHRDKAEAELAALRQPILADDGRSLGNIVESSLNAAGFLNKAPAECYEAAAQAVADVVLAQAVRRMEEVPVDEIGWIVWELRMVQGLSSDKTAEAVRARLIAAAKGEGQPVVVNEPPKDEGQPDLSGESEKQDLGAMVKAAKEAAIKGLTGPAWIPHDGGPCPLKDEEVEEFEFKIRDGKVSGNVFVPSGWMWSNDGTTGDIIAYRILRWKPGFGPEAKAEPAQPTTPHGWTPAVGDVVRLKSGGPVMTVTDVDPLSLMCAWMNADNELQVEPITTLCLTPVPTP